MAEEQKKPVFYNVSNKRLPGLDNNGQLVNPKNPDVFLSDGIRRETYNEILQSDNAPGYDNALINSFRGFNPFNPGPAMMQISDNVIGLMFMTRPELNLSDANIERSEKLISLLGAGKNDLSGYIRGLLDKNWAAGNLANEHPMLDNNLPFISCLNEYLKTSTGFSDLQLRVNTSEPGLRQQVYQYVSSKLEENGQFTIQQTYYNPRPLIIQTLFQVWETYISEVKSGDNEFSPKWQYLFGNRCDHDTRIYHLIMNKDSEFLEGIFAAIRGIPTTYPAGSIADIDRTQSTLRGPGQDDFSVQFSMEGMRFDEISLINSFNEHTYYYNPALYDTILGNSKTYRRLDISEYNAYRYMMYPLLIPMTSDRKVNGRTGTVSSKQGIKLTWWAKADLKPNTGNIRA